MPVQSRSDCNIVTVVQTRTGSTRLPNKIMLPLLGKPVLVRMVERVKTAAKAGIVVVATTTETDDDIIVKTCRREGILCFRGHPTDLLDRHYELGKLLHADAVAKIPSDKPLIDPQVIDRVYGVYLDNLGKYDFVSNLHPETYPYGNDVEIMSMKALETAWYEANRQIDREHTTPFFWENPDRFKAANVKWETGLNYARKYRYTLDYEEDYEVIKAIFEALYPENPYFTMHDILSYLDRNPEIAAFNAMYIDAKWYKRQQDQLKSSEVAA